MERHVGLAEEMRAGGFQPPHHFGVGAGDIVGERRNAPGRRGADQIVGLLDRDRQSVQGPERLAA